MNASHSILLYACALVGSKLIGLMMQPWVTQWLGTTEYGQLDVLITFITCLSLLMTFGLPDAICRFAHDKQLKQEKVLGSALAGILLIGTTLTGLVLLNLPLVQHWLPGTPSLFALTCLSANLLLNTLCTVPLTRLRLNHQPKTFVKALLLFAISQAGFITLLAPLWGIDGIMLAGLLAQLLQLTILWRFFPRLYWGYTARLLRYGRAITVAGLLAFITLGAERWAIADSLSLSELATYAIAMQWAMAASLVLEPFGLWWFPKRFSFTDSAQGLRHAAEMSALGCQLSALVAAMVITIGPDFLRFWLPADFHTSSDILPILALMMMVKQASTYLNMGCYQEESGRSIFLISVISAIGALAAIVFLLPYWGLSALLISGVALQLLRVTLFYVRSQQLLTLPYQLHSLAICYSIVGFIAFCHYTAPTIETPLAIDPLWLKMIGMVALGIYTAWPWRAQLFALNNRRVKSYD
ncbi:hypothetical protein A3K86_09410 [Photobacterium jeanii]|uniref:Lipopolysaccharide biosynthesis protein n=1 Tax=Photobacterium jeanii TaxID=858640 RepID=A0A178KHS2_9GAMM|nr:oligosaccharide flippase family protein [Photobacterium jeanii]OAN16819.1 hypothetical protein A3K86_09410 [Photobacterium jeanii]PST88428.1 polysaccharide biosynthesis family protein [Photobacterium jeanii]